MNQNNVQTGATQKKNLDVVTTRTCMMHSLCSMLSTLGILGSLSGDLTMFYYVGVPLGFILIPLVISCILDQNWRMDKLSRQELATPLDRPASTNHGKQLHDVINGFRKEKLEYVAMFRRNGKKMFEQTNFKANAVHSFPFNMSRKKLVGQIHVHSHPGVGGASFSDRDIGISLSYGFYQSIVVTRRRLYILTNPHYEDTKLLSSEDIEATIKAKRQEKLDSVNVVARFLLPRYIILRWASIYASRYAAERFDLSYQIKYIWWENLKYKLRQIMHVRCRHR